MKKITQVLANEIVSYNGDVEVEGDIYDNAEVTIEDGSLIVHGTIHSGAKVTVKLSQELKKIMQDGSSNSSITTSVNGGYVSIINGSITITGIRTTSGGVTIGQSISADMSIGGDIYVGNVNVNNRIFTEDQLTIKGNGNYEITKSTFMRSANSLGVVAATIDGVRYQANNKIFIEGKKVFVDGLIKNDNLASSSSQPEQPSEPKKVVIHGLIRDNVTLHSDAPIEANNVGINCTLIASATKIKAKDIGNHTTISSTESVELGNVGAHCIINSQQDGLTAKNIGDHVQIQTRAAIEVETIGSFCKINSTQFGIKAGNVGTNTEISVRDAISLGAIGSNSKISSAQYGIKAKKVADNVSISVRDGIQLQSVGNTCTIKSAQYGIAVTETVGSYSTITVRDAIDIGGAVGDNSNLTSNTNRIKLQGAAGNSVTITARDSIKLKNLGYNATVTSSDNSVSIHDIGNNSTVRASGEIDISGECADPTSLNLSTTRNGKITRPRRKVQAPIQNVTNNNSGYVTGSYETDLLQAMQASIQQNAATQVTNTNNNPVRSALVQNSLFATATTQQPETVTIPKSFECPLTLDVMTDPVLCILDGKTYERTAITKWLLDHRSSPMSRQPMRHEQTIEEVLIENRSLLDAIDEFKQNHPQLFIQASP